ncbi:hypothetical protein FQR65_LT15669 [Abscondita terminalis]|nr:hypothetical protein FQR65_LT15669 [Abscondita terminalis]
MFQIRFRHLPVFLVQMLNHLIGRSSDPGNYPHQIRHHRRNDHLRLPTPATTSEDVPVLFRNETF